MPRDFGHKDEAEQYVLSKVGTDTRYATGSNPVLKLDDRRNGG